MAFLTFFLVAWLGNAKFNEDFLPVPHSCLPHFLQLQLYNLSFTLTEAPEIVPFTFGDAAVNEGETAMITCFVKKGDKPVSLTWSLKGDVISSDPALTTTMLGNQASILTIVNVGYRHSGTYTCRASNVAGSVTHSAELLVNGNSNNWHWEHFI